MLRIHAVSAFIIMLAGQVGAADFTGTMRFSDADTVKVGEITVRLFGIDAPESDQTCTRDGGKNWACGKWATRQARRQFDNKRGVCQPIEIDRYGRTVARCYLDGQDIAEELVRQGIAQAFVRYSLDYVSAEKEASIAARGIWAGTLQTPADHRASKRNVVEEVPAKCAIKGNISKNGRIYHVPGQKYYANTKINAARGEKWFCTEAQARAAGWRKSQI